MSTILPPTNNWGDVPADATTPPSVIGRLHRWRTSVVHRLRTSKIAACSGCDAIAGKNPRREEDLLGLRLARRHHGDGRGGRDTHARPHGHMRVAPTRAGPNRPANADTPPLG